MTSNRNLVIAGLGVSIVGLYLANRETINEGVNSIIERVTSREYVEVAGGGGTSTNINPDDRTNTIPNSEHIGGFNEEVIEDAMNFTSSENAQGRRVTATYDEGRNRTTFTNMETGNDVVIFDYRRNISTTPELDRRREEQEGASSRQVFQGAVRPSDNEQLFRQTGVTRPSDVLRNTSLGGFL